MQFRASLGALLVGSVLAVPTMLFSLVVDGSVVGATALGLGLFLPFAVYAAHVDPDPATRFPARPVLAAGSVLGVGLLLVAALDGPTAFGIVVGALTAALAFGYHGRYARTPLSPTLVGVGGTAVGLVVAAVAVLTATPLAGGLGVAAVAAASVDYCRARSYLSRRSRRIAATVALVGGMVVVVGGVLADRATTGIALASALLVVGAALAVE
ncbi:hypothetical protein [Halomarina oriensis]|uniref:Uncharacterized protein n=1 Tax=Halomarina oriensis TaxID=671145 RepID=A0A6B0GLJ6_9EURY|nr:hypothetical protein [Halomarina oriensis]MWG34587.1 hypothetical protein [Halomarina oriensis]